MLTAPGIGTFSALLDSDPKACLPLRNRGRRAQHDGHVEETTAPKNAVLKTDEPAHLWFCCSDDNGIALSVPFAVVEEADAFTSRHHDHGTADFAILNRSVPNDAVLPDKIRQADLLV